MENLLINIAIVLVSVLRIIFCAYFTAKIYLQLGKGERNGKEGPYLFFCVTVCVITLVMNLDQIANFHHIVRPLTLILLRMAALGAACAVVRLLTNRDLCLKWYWEHNLPFIAGGVEMGGLMLLISSGAMASNILNVFHVLFVIIPVAYTFLNEIERIVTMAIPFPGLRQSFGFKRSFMWISLLFLAGLEVVVIVTTQFQGLSYLKSEFEATLGLLGLAAGCMLIWTPEAQNMRNIIQEVQYGQLELQVPDGIPVEVNPDEMNEN